jgi:hypothetical protein
MSTEETLQINRRQFFKTTLGLLPFLALPNVTEVVENGVDVSAGTENAEIWEIIRGLEVQVRQHKGFSKYLHNELRHYYGAVSEEESRRHADVILGHVVMDDYTMNTVSDWHLTYKPPNPSQAIEVMMGTVERYPYFEYLRAACLIKSGEAFELLGMQTKAAACYRAAKNGHGAENDMMRNYHRLAEVRLTWLKQ